MARPLASAILAGEPAAIALLPHDFRDRPARAAVARRAAARAIAPGVLAALEEAQERLPPSPARRANLAALAAGNTAVVVSGQQVGLFAGPLYSFYKAASAVAVARALEREANVRCVPLFWLQTEDHDWPEIDHCHVLGSDGAIVRIQVTDPAPHPRVSVAHRRLGPDVADALARLEEALGPDAPAVMDRLRAAYVPGRAVAQAFAEVMAGLFADEGLLVLDPRQRPVAQAAAPLYARAIEQHEEIAARLLDRRRALAELGFDEQVAVRPECPLLFFHQGDATGPRYRLRREQAGFSLAGTGDAVGAAAIAAALASDPLRFSTSTLLRPIVQDALLPAAVYLGGPAELAYFTQIAPLYPVFGVDPAVVAPRARFRFVDARTGARLAKLGLAADDLADPRIAPAGGHPAPAAVKAELEAAITSRLEALVPALVAVDPNLRRPAERTRATITAAVRRLCDKYARTLLVRDEVTSRRLASVQAALLPQGIPQERFYGWPSLAARLGPDAFKAKVLEAIVPFGTGLREIGP